MQGRFIKADGDPILGAFVFFNEDFENNLLTDKDGGFKAEVEAPYTLTILYEGLAIHLVGLTNPEPVIVGTDELRPLSEVHFEGQTDLPAPIPSQEQIACAVAGAHSCNLTLNKEKAAFSATAKLYEDLEREKGDVLLVHTEHPDDLTINFLGAARLSDVDFTELETLEVEFSEVLTFEAAIELDPGAYENDLAAKLLSYTVDGLSVHKSNRVPLDATFKVPTEGGVIQVTGTTATGAAVFHHFPAKSGKMEVSLPENSQMHVVRPKKNATVSSTPVIEWTHVEGARSYFVVLLSSSGVMYVTLPGNQNSMRVPDLSEYGLDHASAYFGAVYSVPPEAELDAEDLARAGLGFYRLEWLESGTYFMDGFQFEIKE